MSEFVISAPASMNWEMQKHIIKTRGGKIRTASKSKSNTAIKLTVLVLLALTVFAFATFDYQAVDLGSAVAATWNNAATLFTRPHLKSTSMTGIMNALLVTFSLGVLSTIAGAVIAVFGSLLCAKNIANPTVANIVKSIVAFIRAVPTILWVLIFTVSAGLGSVAAVTGLTFHSVAYLIKAYSESIEEMDEGAIEALKASGAGFWQIVFQAILPSSARYMTAWTFLRFEINFTNAIAIGAAAGAGGIGYDLFMAGSFYFDLRELGFITYVVVISVILLEVAATKIKAKVR